MRHINAVIGFEIGLQLSANSADSPVHSGRRDITMATNFGTEIAINDMNYTVARYYALANKVGIKYRWCPSVYMSIRLPDCLSYAPAVARNRG